MRISSEWRRHILNFTREALRPPRNPDTLSETELFAGDVRRLHNGEEEWRNAFVGGIRVLDRDAMLSEQKWKAIITLFYCNLAPIKEPYLSILAARVLEGNGLPRPPLARALFLRFLVSEGYPVDWESFTKTVNYRGMEQAHPLMILDAYVWARELERASELIERREIPPSVLREMLPLWQEREACVLPIPFIPRPSFFAALG